MYIGVLGFKNIIGRRNRRIINVSHELLVPDASRTKKVKPNKIDTKTFHILFAYITSIIVRGIIITTNCPRKSSSPSLCSRVPRRKLARKSWKIIFQTCPLYYKHPLKTKGNPSTGLSGPYHRQQHLESFDRLQGMRFTGRHDNHFTFFQVEGFA